jgi:CRISPR-associated endoribonuclease Cas2 subtype I-E
MGKELLAEGGSMVVMILECVPTVLRGELSRWLTPVGGGVHVGQVSTLVREELWKLARARAASSRFGRAVASRATACESMGWWTPPWWIWRACR